MPTQVSLSQPHRGLFTRHSSYYSTMYGGGSGFGPPSYSDDSDSALEDMTEVSESESEPEIDSESISQAFEAQNKPTVKSKPKSKPKPKATQKFSRPVNFLAEDLLYDTEEEDEYIIRSMTESLLSKAQHINPALIAPTPSSPRPTRNVKKPNYSNHPTTSETEDDTSSISTNQIDHKLLDLLTSEDESSIPDDLDVIELEYDLDPELLSPTNSQSDPDLDPRRRIEIQVKKKINKHILKKKCEKQGLNTPILQITSDISKPASTTSCSKLSLSKYFCMICDSACTDNDTNHLSCKICNIHFHKSCINVQSEISDYICRPCRKEQKNTKPKQIKKFKRSSLARKYESQSEPSSNSSSPPPVPKIKIKTKPSPVSQVSNLDFSDTSSDSDSSPITRNISKKLKSKRFKAKYPLCPPSSPDQSQSEAGKCSGRSNLSTSISEPSQSRTSKRPGKSNLLSLCRPISPTSPQSRAGKRPMKANLSSLYNQSSPRPTKRSVESMRSESLSPVIQACDANILISDSDEEIQLPPKRKTLSSPSSPRKTTQPRKLPMISFSDSEDDTIIPKHKSSTRPPSPIKHDRHSKSLTRPSSPISTKHNHTHPLHSKTKSIRKPERPKAMKKPRTHQPGPSASHPTKFSSAQFKPQPRPSRPVVASQTLKLTKTKPILPSSSAVIADEENDIIIIDSEEEDLDCCPICVGICTC